MWLALTALQFEHFYKMLRRPSSHPQPSEWTHGGIVSRLSFEDSLEVAFAVTLWFIPSGHVERGPSAEAFHRGSLTPQGEESPVNELAHEAFISLHSFGKLPHSHAAHSPVVDVSSQCTRLTSPFW
jgi:hypothetical protein